MSKTLARTGCGGQDQKGLPNAFLDEGDLGYLVSGTLDLDNADNVVRGCYLMGLDAPKLLPLELAKWLATQSGITLNL